jgi:hypothetical protein
MLEQPDVVDAALADLVRRSEAAGSQRRRRRA